MSTPKAQFVGLVKPPSVITIEEPLWQRTLTTALSAIVSIRFSQIASFDSEPAESSEATGFVVDAERGLILTNRHVVCSGPFIGEAIFHDHEECECRALYRDPIHDFGFLKFNPACIKYSPHGVTQIELDPEKAQIGLDIRVVGNDAGEKLSILAGSISRLNRNVPDYGDLSYNDFNTFYLQAAASTSGGSSGSPVLNLEGRAVGLQAGGHYSSATDFFFPLDRVKRALDLLKKGEPVTRGTMQVQWLHRPFDEVRRLGLSVETEKAVRHQNATEIGMLVAEVVLPCGPADGLLEDGDVLVTINGQMMTHFVVLEELLDSNSGNTISVCVERGGQSLEYDITVQDLHSITPDRYLEASGAKFNNLSYQLARQFCVAASGVYMCDPGGSFKLDHSSDTGYMIESLNSIPTPNLDAFVEAFASIPDRESVPMVYYYIADVHNKCSAIVTIDRHWCPFRMVIRNDSTGIWEFKDLRPPPPPSVKPILSTVFAKHEMESNQPVWDLWQSIVKVTMYFPIKIEGFPRHKRHGVGLVIDAEKGLVLIARSVVAHSLGDISVTIAESIVIRGYPEFLHPTLNIAIVRYDPTLIGSTPIKTAPLADTPLRQGQKVSLVALSKNRSISIETNVTEISPACITPNSNPRFRPINFDAVSLDTPLAQGFSTGILSNSNGLVQGLWFTVSGDPNSQGYETEYSTGMCISRIIESVIRPFCSSVTPILRGLAAEFTPIQISQARSMGLSQEWVNTIESADPTRRQVFLVRRMIAESSTSTLLRDLDIILSLDGVTVTRVDAFRMFPKFQESMQVVLLRDKRELTLSVPTMEIKGECTTQVVFWAGAILHEPHISVRLQSRTLPSRIYVSFRGKGSPAYQYGLMPTLWITHVNGQATHTLSQFLAAVKGLANTFVRVKVISFDFFPSVLTIKLNSHYWPTFELIRDPTADSGWQRVLY